MRLNRGGISVLYTNAQSVRSKILELDATANDKNPDIILITESWTNNNVTDNVLYLTNYDLISELRNDRTDTADGRGGGLLVYVKKGLQILPVDNNSWRNADMFRTFYFSEGTLRNIGPPSTSIIHWRKEKKW